MYSKFFWNLDGNLMMSALIFLFSLSPVASSLTSASESELLADSFKKAKMRKVEVKNATEKMNGSSKIASDKLIKDEGKETLDNRSKDQRALHKMRKNEIKEHLENRSKEQRVSPRFSRSSSLVFFL